jgi:hypothetical protein
LLTFVSPSKHKDGNTYTAFDTEQIAILDNVGQMRIESRIAAVIPDYLSEDQTNQYIKYLELDTTILNEGERHNGILVMANSYFFRYSGEWADLTDDQRFNKLIEFDKKKCRPSLYDTPSGREEFKRIWDDVCHKFASRRQEERKSRSRSKSKEKNKEDLDLVRKASEKIMDNHSIATLEETDEILYSRDGVFVRGGEVVIRKAAEAMFEYDLNINDRAEIREHIKCHTYHTRDEFDSDLNIINLKNGLYKINTDEFTPHETTYLSMKQKPIRFNRSVGRHPSKFIKFLKEVVYPSDIWTVIELMAYTFLANRFYLVY